MLLTQDWIILLVISMTCAAAAVFWLSRRPVMIQKMAVPNLSNKVYLFAGPNLIDASAAAEEFPDDDIDITDWQRLYGMFIDRFPDFPTNYESLKIQGRTVILAEAEGDTGSIIGEWIDGITRIEVCEKPIEDTPAPPELSPSHELETLRIAVSEAPYPVWRIDQDGSVGWHNNAYKMVYEKVRKTAPDPTCPLFNPTIDQQSGVFSRRVSITAPDSDKAYWFDISAMQQDDFCLFYAFDINAVVDAEVAQRNFVQTLAKTFAQLSIGLAIFDRNRQLVLFNPALIDLTSLGADFLSSRPNLFSFFDRLRDSQMMPEPKNYNDWRHQMANLVAAAADGRYQETWSLPSGSVYSVNGRPHPDGAIAFLFEDITAEVTLTRRFRSDLELGQSILDNIPDAIVVFGPDSVLTMCNKAYRTLWNVNPDSSFANVTVLDATRDWQNRCDATQVWSTVRDSVIDRENRTKWWENIHLKSGEPITCTVCPVQSGATMITFSRQPASIDSNPKQHQISNTD